MVPYRCDLDVFGESEKAVVPMNLVWLICGRLVKRIAHGFEGGEV
jgi:hypothetical protein